METIVMLTWLLYAVTNAGVMSQLFLTMRSVGKILQLKRQELATVVAMSDNIERGAYNAITYSHVIVTPSKISCTVEFA